MEMNYKDVPEQPLLSKKKSDRMTYGGSTKDAHVPVDPDEIRASGASASYVRNREDGSGEDAVTIALPPNDMGDSLDNIKNNDVAIALDKCKKYVLGRYLFLLKLLGWLPWMSDEDASCCAEGCTKILNKTYPLLVVGIIMLGYILGMASCLSRSHLFYASVPGNQTVLNCNSSLHEYKKRSVCPNIITTYVWLDVLHLVSYLYAFYIFRWCRSEELETVMTKTFLQSTAKRHAGFLSQGALTRKLRTILIVGVAWVLIQVVINVFVVVVRIADCQETPSGRFGFSSWIAAETDLTIFNMYVLIVFTLIGVFGMDMVSVAVAVNYGAQCELLIFLIRGLNEQIEEKSISLKDVMKKYYAAGHYIDSLGRQMAIAMSLIEVILIVQAIVSFVSLYDVKKESETVHTTEILFFVIGVLYVLIWTVIATFALIQAARLNSALSAAVEVSLDVCLYDYPGASQSEINLFIVYMTSHSQRRAAKLFYLPIYVGHLCGLVAALFTVFLTLSLFDVLKFTIPL